LTELSEKVGAAARFVRERWDQSPHAGLILGTGLHAAAEHLAQEAAIPFGEIPYFSQATALGHAGRLICGQWQSIPVVVLDGRLHRYEGYGWNAITFPVRVMHALGTPRLILTNAAGGMNPNFHVGDQMVVLDHLNFLFPGPPDVALLEHSRNPNGPYYDAELIEQARSVARRENIALQQGVYAALPGPNYETRSEYRLLRRCGADAVGMSTVPEVLAAAALGLRVLAVSTITNRALPDALTHTTSDAVVRAAGQASRRLERLLSGVLHELAG